MFFNTVPETRFFKPGMMAAMTALSSFIFSLHYRYEKKFFFSLTKLEENMKQNLHIQGKNL